MLCIFTSGKSKEHHPEKLEETISSKCPGQGKEAALMDNMIMAKLLSKLKLRSKDWNVSHSLTKPLNGGMAEIDKTPIRIRIALTGILLIKPPSFSIFFVWVEYNMEPAPMKSKPLKTEWFNR